jgi:YfiR/HmsC-like
VALLSGAQAAAAAGRGARGSLAILLLLALVCASTAQGQTPVSEVNLKSAFLYKFIHYAEWPQEALGELENPIVICVIDQDALAQVLEGAVSGRTSHERPVVVRRVDGSDPFNGCHVLFVGAMDASRMDQVIARASAQPILTVGDAEGFARRGGMINFIPRGTRLGFEINRGAVRRAGLDLSSQLLKLAQLVPDESGGG